MLALGLEAAQDQRWTRWTSDLGPLITPKRATCQGSDMIMGTFEPILRHGRIQKYLFSPMLTLVRAIPSSTAGLRQRDPSADAVSVTEHRLGQASCTTVVRKGVES